jgi:hypothetical protein
MLRLRVIEGSLGYFRYRPIQRAAEHAQLAIWFSDQYEARQAKLFKFHVERANAASGAFTPE